MESGLCEEQLNQADTLLQSVRDTSALPRPLPGSRTRVSRAGARLAALLGSESPVPFLLQDIRLLNAGKASQHLAEIERDLDKAEAMIRLLFNDVQALKDGRHPQGEQMYRRSAALPPLLLPHTCQPRPAFAQERGASCWCHREKLQPPRRGPLPLRKAGMARECCTYCPLVAAAFLAALQPFCSSSCHPQTRPHATSAGRGKLWPQSSPQGGQSPSSPCSTMFPLPCRVYRLHERLVAIRTEYNLRLKSGSAPVTQVSVAVTQRPRQELGDVTLRYLQDLLVWVEENQSRISAAEWGVDLPTVESQLGSHRGLHHSIEEFRPKIERARADEVGGA